MTGIELSALPTFDDYLLTQATRAFAAGPPLRADVLVGLPKLLSRMAVCRSLRAGAEERDGLRVPAVAFMAVTGACNLRCAHCYTSGYRPEHMDAFLARRILSQACELGVSLFVVTGGEPLLNRDFMAIPREMPDVPFLVFTNGSLVPEFLASGAASPNMLWAVSADGPREFSDARRGIGSFDAAISAMSALREAGLPFGFSATLAAENAAAVISDEFLAQMAGLGCRAGFFLEQIPSPPTDPPLGRQIARLLAPRRRNSPIPIVAFPADEVTYGGCQAAGHGIIHISPDGAVEPCPAAHLAADSLADVSLEEALSSPFLQAFRDMKEELATGEESCAYADNRAAINAEVARMGAVQTDSNRMTGARRGGAGEVVRQAAPS